MHIPGYHIVRKINQGGMSTVYLAIQLSVGREVALKVMSPALNADPVFSERFQREATIVGQLSHPNIVSIYDIGRHKQLNYIAMDYLPGGSVHDRMAQGLGLGEALRIAKETALALDHAHAKGYVHRDIKPENILIRQDDSAVLSDFGVAKTVASAARMTNAGMVVGTPHYMSPEQARGHAIDGRSDIYGLGIVFYEMLTGSVPFKAEEAVAIAIKHLTAPVPELPPQYALYQPILTRLLAKDPDDRYQRGNELVAALDALVAAPAGLRQPTLLTHTEPTAVQIMLLFKALLVTSFTALAIKLRDQAHQLLSWRWSRQRGFYRAQASDIRVRAEAQTLVSSHLQVPPPKRALRMPRALIAVLLVSFAAGGLGWHLLSPAPAAPESIVPSEASLSELQSSPSSLPATASADLAGTADLAPDTKLEAVEPPQAASEDTAPEPLVQAEPEVIEPPAPTRFGLSIQPTPNRARVRILNIRERYRHGIELLPGKYHVEVSAPGYDTQTHWLRLRERPLSKAVSLRQTPVAGHTFSSALAGGASGPSMVVIPAGKFSHTSDAGTPPEDIHFKRPFAVGQFEVTFADYAHFAAATDRALPADKGWGRDNRPAINLSWEDAHAYTEWLSEQTGKRYRLPSEAEWEYAARAGTSGAFWWGADNAKLKANCRRGCKSKYAGLFSSKTAPVGSYAANPFGLFDTAGNVAEWVADCFNPGDSAQQCAARTVRGGSMKSAEKDIRSSSRESLAPSAAAETVGFRVLLELY